MQSGFLHTWVVLLQAIRSSRISILKHLPFLAPIPSLKPLSSCHQNGSQLFCPNSISVSRNFKPFAFFLPCLNPDLANAQEAGIPHLWSFSPYENILALPSIFSPTPHSQWGHPQPTSWARTQNGYHGFITTWIQLDWLQQSSGNLAVLGKMFDKHSKSLTGNWNFWTPSIGRLEKAWEHSWARWKPI